MKRRLSHLFHIQWEVLIEKIICASISARYKSCCTCVQLHEKVVFRANNLSDKQQKIKYKKLERKTIYGKLVTVVVDKIS